MAASTKLVLVVVALLLGVSILFYSVMFGGSDPLEVSATDSAAAEIAPPETADPASPTTPTTARPALGGGSVALADRPARPSLSNPRPALGARATPSPAGPASEARAALGRPNSGDGARRPLGAAAPTTLGQVEMGSGRGALAGGTSLPEAERAPAIQAAPERTLSPGTGATPRPALGSPTASNANDNVAPLATTPAPPATAGTRRQDPARILTVTYSIRSGDTLSSIAAARLGAARHWRLIAEKNPGLDPARLIVGQRIVLPSRASVDATAARAARAAAARTATPIPATRPGERVHEVASGDTLSSIAARYLGGAQRWKLIADRNRDLLGGDANRLAVGMKLRIPRAPAG